MVGRDETRSGGGTEWIRTDEHGTLEAVFRAHYPGLLRFAQAQLGSEAEAEDVVHDVFLRVWRDREHLRVRVSLQAYLLTGVGNRVKDLLRRRALERRWFDRDDAAAAEAAGRVEGGAGTASPADDAEAAQLAGAIRHAIADLPDRCRTAFLLCREQEMTYAQAAVAMGVSPATVKTQVARALAALRTALGPFLLVTACAGPRLL
jgi:RNA polymerase sigma-70 factor, ECF subfamily